MTKPEIDLDVALKLMYRRAQRTLIPNADARSYLKYIAKKYLKKLKEGQEKNSDMEQYMKNFIMQHVHKLS